MVQYLTVTDDRALVGQVVELAADRSHMPRKELAAAAGVGRATLYRVIGGDPNVAQRTLRQLEETLSLPYDTLTFVAAHDWQTLEGIELPEHLLTWLRHQSRAHRGVQPD